MRAPKACNQWRWQSSCYILAVIATSALLTTAFIGKDKELDGPDPFPRRRLITQKRASASHLTAGRFSNAPDGAGTAAASGSPAAHADSSVIAVLDDTIPYSSAIEDAVSQGADQDMADTVVAASADEPLADDGDTSSAPGAAELPSAPDFPAGCTTKDDDPTRATVEETILRDARRRALETGYPKGGYLAICAAVRDQHADLPEWLEYHLRLGASHVYVYDTGSDPPLDKVLGPYVKGGLATLRTITNFTAARQDLKHTTCHTYSPQFQQLIAYAYCLRDYGARHRFMAFIDVDEFLVLTDDGHQDLPSLLQEYEGFGGLAVNWRMFGSSGHKTRQPLTMLSYTKCYPKEEDENLHVKTIANTAYLARMDGAHHGLYAPGRYAVNTAKKRVDGPKSVRAKYDRLVLHHYVTKSEQEYKEKMARGSGMGRQKDMAYWHRVQHRAVEDCTEGVHAWKRLWTPWRR